MTLTVEDATIGYTTKGCIVAVASDGLEVVDGGHVNVGNQTSVKSALALIDGCGKPVQLLCVTKQAVAVGIVVDIVRLCQCADGADAVHILMGGNLLCQLRIVRIFTSNEELTIATVLSRRIYHTVGRIKHGESIGIL